MSVSDYFIFDLLFAAGISLSIVITLWLEFIPFYTIAKVQCRPLCVHCQDFLLKILRKVGFNCRCGCRYGAYTAEFGVGKFDFDRT